MREDQSSYRRCEVSRGLSPDLSQKKAANSYVVWANDTVGTVRTRSRSRDFDAPSVDAYTHLRKLRVLTYAISRDLTNLGFSPLPN